MSESIEVTLIVGMDGSMLPRSFIWQNKTFLIESIGRRWEDEGGEHIMVLVAPVSNAYQLLRKNDGRWYLEQGHDRPTVRFV